MTSDGAKQVQKRYLGRKLKNRADWEVSPDLAADEVPARLLTVTAELRAKDNTLSFYESVESGDEAIQRTALALASAGDRIDPISVAWVDRALLEGDGIVFRASDGTTPVKDLRASHIEAVSLDAFRLAKVASRLATAIRGNDQLRILTRDEVRMILQDAVDARQVGYSELKVEIRQELNRPT